MRSFWVGRAMLNGEKEEQVDGVGMLLCVLSRLLWDVER